MKPANADLTHIKRKIRERNELIGASEKSDDLKSLLTNYRDEAISMPEYQLTLSGIAEIETFYKEIFRRQNIKSVVRSVEEFVDLGQTIVEIGTFKKEYSELNTDVTMVLNGKYYNVWEVQSDGDVKLKGESYGFFHPVDNPEALTIDIKEPRPNSSDHYSKEKISFELKAYNALMEKGVRIRDGVLRSEFFTEDARFMPFADSTKSGIEQLKPYLIAYSTRGNVTIDSIACYTYHHEDLNDFILEYAMFKVKWRVPDFSGRTEGKGIRIWKRQEDKSLKLYREIGTHDHLK